MKADFRKHAGFTVVELVVVVVVVGLLAFVGFSVRNRLSSSDNAALINQSATAQDVPKATAVSTTSDLDKQLTVLDQTDTSSSDDLMELDSQLEAF